MGRIVNLNRLNSLEKFSGEFSNMNDDYVFSHFTSDPDGERAWHNTGAGPMRIDGSFMLLCFSGQMEFEVNLVPCTLEPGSFICTPPGSILELRGLSDGKVDCYGLFVSTDFLSDINFDLNVLSTLPMSTPDRRNHVFRLTPMEMAKLSKYFDLLHYNGTSDGDPTFTRPIARSLIAALAYEMIMMFMQRMEHTPRQAPQTSRRATYVHSFLRLVHQYHRSERAVTFYAEKLFISPKYLSLIVKEQTGRSAAQLIDSFVILEAKNLLRFSGKNIQQVAYELNFPNQSSFGKYFKHLTGMSPSDYQKSN